MFRGAQGSSAAVQKLKQQTDLISICGRWGNMARPGLHPGCPAEWVGWGLAFTQPAAMMTAVVKACAKDVFGMGGCFPPPFKLQSQRHC